VHIYQHGALAHTRKSCGLSRQDVADRLGVSKYAIIDWENGRRHPSVVRLGALADLFCVTPTTFYRWPGGSGGA
jgi:transcriptional regulator with XRE-family HTH domain